MTTKTTRKKSEKKTLISTLKINLKSLEKRLENHRSKEDKIVREINSFKDAIKWAERINGK